MDGKKSQNKQDVENYEKLNLENTINIHNLVDALPNKKCHIKLYFVLQASKTEEQSNRQHVLYCK